MKGRRGQPSLEEQLRAAAEAFPYPPTPDIARAVRGHVSTTVRGRARPQLRWTVAALLLFLLSLLAVPQVRAGIGALFRVGAIEVVIPTPLPTALPSQEPAAENPSPPPTATRHSTPTPLFSVLDLAGETTFAEAGRQANFPLRLPTYPKDLGPPDRVFVQDLGGPAVILVWMDPGHADQARISLHQLGNDIFGEKTVESREVLEETTVNNRPALWVRGPHFLRFKGRPDDDFPEPARLVDGNVLIWEDEDGITFRLETTASLEEARRIAESVR